MNVIWSYVMQVNITMLMHQAQMLTVGTAQQVTTVLSILMMMENNHQQRFLPVLKVTSVLVVKMLQNSVLKDSTALLEQMLQFHAQLVLGVALLALVHLKAIVMKVIIAGMKLGHQLMLKKNLDV